MYLVRIFLEIDSFAILFFSLAFTVLSDHRSESLPDEESGRTLGVLLVSMGRKNGLRSHAGYFFSVFH